MRIGGVQKVTFIDYPQKIACTVFTIGCNFKCPFCQNSHLVLPEKIKSLKEIPERDFFSFLKERKDFLEGVVICGGEPTIYSDLPGFARKIKKLGFLVKLDTNGSNPKMLEDLIREKLIDYVSLDVKAPKEKYDKVCGKKIDIRKIEKSIEILKKREIDYEFRTTLVPTLIEKEDIFKIVKWISPAKRYYLQNFQPQNTIDPSFEKIKPFDNKYLLEIKKIISPFFEMCEIR